jgi:hypothetical protein
MINITSHHPLFVLSLSVRESYSGVLLATIAGSRLQDMAHIPIVDFAPTTTGTQAEKEHVAQQIDDAFRTAGFVYLKNHGVSRDKVAECFEWVSFP